MKKPKPLSKRLSKLQRAQLADSLKVMTGLKLTAPRSLQKRDLNELPLFHQEQPKLF